MIEIGRVGKPHGVRGGCYVDGAIDAPALVPGFGVHLGDRLFTIESRGGTDARPIVMFAEVSGRDAIAELRGASLLARRDSLTPLVAGEWYAADLVGLTVETRAGTALGKIERLVNAPSVDLLEVVAIDGGQLLVPMVGDAIVEIDVVAGWVRVDEEFLNLG